MRRNDGYWVCYDLGDTHMPYPIRQQPVSGKEKRFKILTIVYANKLSRRLKAQLGIEYPKYIRSRSRVTVKSQRDRHSKWAFGDLRSFYIES